MAEATAYSVPVESPPAPQVPIDGGTKASTLKTTPGTVMDHPSDLSPQKSSSVLTLEPFIPDSALSGSLSRRKDKNQRVKSSNRMKPNVNQVEILPGVYEPNAYNKFLTLSLENEKKLDDLDIFEVHRDIVSCIGREPKISSINGGSLLIEVTSNEESEKLQRMKKLNGTEAKCIPHPSMNQSKGVVYSRELLNYSEDKLLDKFRSHKVVAVHRMKKKVNGILCPQPLLILTFDLLKLPDAISAAWLRLPVKPYFPSPRRCFYCQMYGHLNTTCRRKLKEEPEICVNCGEEVHGTCNRTPHCINCKGNHDASDKTCERYIFEKNRGIDNKDQRTHKF